MALSCERMLPSNERLPTLTTRPPMSSGSTASDRITCLPKRAASRERIELDHGVGERGGGGDRGADDPRLGVGQGAELLDDAAEDVDPLLAQEQPEEVLVQGLEVRGGEEALERAEAVGHRELRVLEQLDDARLLGEEDGGVLEVREDLLGEAPRSTATAISDLA